MRYARLLDVRLTAGNKVIFQDATRIAVRMVVTGNDQTELTKLDNAMKHLRERAPERSKKMNAIEMKAMNKNGIKPEDLTALSDQVAASKIQTLFRRPEKLSRPVRRGARCWRREP